MSLEWEQTIVDAHDPAALGRRWLEALGWVVVDDDPRWCEITPALDRLPGLLFVPVAEGKPAEPTSDGPPGRAHNKLHLDLHVGPERRGQVVERLVASGATKLWDGEQEDSTWVTMADQDGNEFCAA